MVVPSYTNWTDRDLPLVSFARLDANFHPLGRPQLGKPFSPLDQYHRLFVEQLFQSDFRGLVQVFQTIEIDMVDLGPLRLVFAILMNQREGRARNLIRLGR